MATNPINSGGVPGLGAELIEQNPARDANNNFVHTHTGVPTEPTDGPFCVENKCKLDAIQFVKEKHYEHVPGIVGLANNIIKNPEKYYEEYLDYDDMEEYIEYICCRDQQIS